MTTHIKKERYARYDPTLPSPVTVTLEQSTLVAHYCTLLARAALIRIERAEADAYWSSECGRRRSNTLHCGEQDAVQDRLDRMTFQAEWYEMEADVIGTNLAAAGYPLPQFDHHEVTKSELLTCVIKDQSWIAEIRAVLRQVVSDGMLVVRPTKFNR